MKKLFLSIIGILLITSLWAQETFTNYKAIVSDDAGSILVSHTIDVKFSIYEGNPEDAGSLMFEEIHNTTTDTNGIIVLEIGSINTTDWLDIDWTNDEMCYLTTEFNIGSGYVDMGTQVFRFVPYAQFSLKSNQALFAQEAGQVDFFDIENLPTGLSDGDDNTQLTETEVDNYVSDNGYLTTEVDGSTTNELQTISKTGSTVTLSNGGGSFTDTDTDTHLTETQVDNYVADNGYLTTEVDGSVSNELQTLSVSGTTLTISDGNSVILPTGSGGDQWGTQVVQSDATISGEGTTASPLSAVDGSITNELQTISKTGSTVTLSNGGGSFTDTDTDTHLTETQVDNYVADNGYLTTEVDGSVTNELQTISKTGSTVTLSDGGGSFTDDNTTYTAGTGISIYGSAIYNDIYALNDLADARTINTSIFLGTNSGINDNGGANNRNVGVGRSSLAQNESGEANVAIGFCSLKDATGSGGNTAVGFSSGSETTSGSNNVFLGLTSGYHNTTGSNNVFLGYRSGFNETGSNKLYIENSNSSTPLIGGDFDTDEVTINGSLETTEGMYNNLEGSSSGVKYGTKTLISNSNSSAHYGSMIEMSGVGTGIQKGTDILISNTGNANHTGVKINLSGSGSGAKHGVSSYISSSAGGTHYGVYSVAQKTGSYAGYFMGDIYTRGNQKIRRNSDATNGQLNLIEEGAGDGARIMFENVYETDNKWTLYGKADNTDNDNYFNIHHTTAGNILVVRGNGKVGIKRTPITNTLEVNGTASKATAGSWLANSDRRLKTNINTIEQTDALDKILALRGVTYEWNDNKTGNTRPTGVQYGFIAQELMEVFPSKVSKDQLGYYQTAYGDYDPLFVQAIKELSKQTDELKNIVAKQQELIEKLNKKLEKLESE